MSREYSVQVVFFGVCAFLFLFVFLVVGLSRGSARVAVVGGLVGAALMVAIDLFTHYHPHAR